MSVGVGAGVVADVAGVVDMVAAGVVVVSGGAVEVGAEVGTLDAAPGAPVHDANVTSTITSRQSARRGRRAVKPVSPRLLASERETCRWLVIKHQAGSMSRPALGTSYDDTMN